MYRYDANGNQTAVIDAAGRETDFAYDAANRLILTTYPALGDGSPRHQISTDYDGLGNKTREIDEAGVATSYTYDWRGLVTSVTLDAGSPNAIIWNYTYDESGNLLSQADPNGAVTQFAYDALGRRTQRRLADGSKENHQLRRHRRGRQSGADRRDRLAQQNQRHH